MQEVVGIVAGAVKKVNPLQIPMILGQGNEVLEKYKVLAEKICEKNLTCRQCRCTANTTMDEDGQKKEKYWKLKEDEIMKRLDNELTEEERTKLVTASRAKKSFSRQNGRKITANWQETLYYCS